MTCISCIMLPFVFLSPLLSLSDDTGNVSLTSFLVFLPHIEYLVLFLIHKVVVDKIKKKFAGLVRSLTDV